MDTMNAPAYKTKPICDWTKADLDEDIDFRHQFAQMMNNQALNLNELPDPISPESIGSASIGRLISESPVSSINGNDQPVDVTSTQGQSAFPAEMNQCTNTVKKLFSCPEHCLANPGTLSLVERKLTASSKQVIRNPG